MKARGIAFSLLAVAVLRLSAADGADVVGREAQLAAGALAKQNEVLRAEIGRLREEVATLTMELARTRALLDEAKVGTAASGRQATAGAGDGGQRGGAATASGSWQITDVNPDLKLVVLYAGKGGGLKQGMLLYALRGEKPAARLRVVDVREQMTGAVIEEIFGSGRPEKGDRVVLMAVPR